MHGTSLGTRAFGPRRGRDALVPSVFPARRRSGARCENSQGSAFGRCRPLTYTYVSISYTYDFRRAIEMKKKLTVTVDADVLPIAKQYARAKGVSLSSLIERSLRLMAAGETPSFASRWRGRLQAARGDDPRYEALAKKYL